MRIERAHAACCGNGRPHGIILATVPPSSPSIRPCQAQPGESPEQLRDRVLMVYTAISPTGPLQIPIRCGNADYGYTHLLAEQEDHGDPLADPVFAGELVTTLQCGGYRMQANGNPRWTRQYDQDESSRHHGAWGFRVIAALPAQADRLPLGIISAFYLSAPPAEFP